MHKLERMKELSTILSEAAKAYYQESREIMSNFEYDKLYDELAALEEETGTRAGTGLNVLANERFQQGSAHFALIPVGGELALLQVVAVTAAHVAA